MVLQIHRLSIHSKEGIMAQALSPLTGIFAEDRVYLDFGEHEGKSILEIADTNPEYYQYLLERKNNGMAYIRRAKDKNYRLYVSTTL